MPREKKEEENHTAKTKGTRNEKNLPGGARKVKGKTLKYLGSYSVGEFGRN